MAKFDRTAPAVRVSLPASVAADIGSLKKAVGGILDKLGCQACCSGHDILFELQREIALPALDKAPVAGFRRAALEAAPTAVAKASVRVGLAPKIADDIDGVFAAIDRIAEFTGHPACATGCDMFLSMERSFLLDRSLEIREQAMTIG